MKMGEVKVLTAQQAWNKDKLLESASFFVFLTALFIYSTIIMVGMTLVMITTKLTV